MFYDVGNSQQSTYSSVGFYYMCVCEKEREIAGEGKLARAHE
jgi:hypothetical protein